MENIVPYLPWSLVVASLGTNFLILRITSSARDKFVNKDVCKIITAQAAKTIDEIKVDVKELLNRVPARTE